jgi:U3 small nucleolar RNA-associated protein 3
MPSALEWSICIIVRTTIRFICCDIIFLTFPELIEALLTYATTLAFYLHLRSDKKYAQHPEMLRSHPILSRLLTLKQSLNTLEELEPEADEDGEDDDDTLMDADQIWNLDRKKGLESDELKDLLEDAKKPTPKPKSKLATEQPPKKKCKTASTELEKPLSSVFDLVEPVFTSPKYSSTHARSDAGIVDPYGESTSLQHADAADKSARRKTLRFHTAKIESASARRQGARTNAMGGDDDLPYKERRKEKEMRLDKAANAKVRGQGGEDLDNIEPEPKKLQKEEKNSGDEVEEGADGYYELVKNKSREKRVQKKAQYEAARAATR